MITYSIRSISHINLENIRNYGKDNSRIHVRLMGFKIYLYMTVALSAWLLIRASVADIIMATDANEFLRKTGFSTAVKMGHSFCLFHVHIIKNMIFRFG